MGPTRGARVKRVFVAALVLGSLAASLSAVSATAQDAGSSPSEQPRGDGRIVGGTVASSHEYPHAAAVIWKNQLICGGTVLSRQWVLTAAHCVDWIPEWELSAYLQVRVGSNRWDTGGQLREAFGVVVHPYWQLNTAEYDMALVRMDDAAFGLSVDRASLPEPGMNRYWDSGSPAALAGWGLLSPTSETPPKSLRENVSVILPSATCASAYPTQRFVDGILLPAYTSQSMLCVGPDDGSTSACNGDSGSGVLVSAPGGPYVVGSVSWGLGCAVAGWPIVYARAWAARNWITRTIPVNDDYRDAYLLTGEDPYRSDMEATDAEPGEPALNFATPRSVWFHCLASTDGPAVLSTNGTPYASAIALFTGGPAMSDLTRIGLVRSGANPLDGARLSFEAVRGEYYTVQVDGGEDRFNLYARGLGCGPPTFADVVHRHPFFADIEWMGMEGIATGYVDSTFRPVLAVSRQAMAAYLWRLAGAPGGPFPDPGFPDVPASNQFHTAISWMVASGIASGFPDGNFHPTAAVSRQAMAAFLHRMASSPPGPFPAPGFPDVVDGVNPFFLEISWMVDAGVADGYADGMFRPGAPVSRQAMSRFLHDFSELP